MPRTKLLVDPVLGANLIKLDFLLGTLTVESENVIFITGIMTNHPVRTLGTINVRNPNIPVQFQVVRKTFLISADGILIRPYLHQELAQISFTQPTLVTSSEPATHFSS